MQDSKSANNGIFEVLLLLFLISGMFAVIGFIFGDVWAEYTAKIKFEKLAVEAGVAEYDNKTKEFRFIKGIECQKD
jgi:hypothetical protein